MFKRIAKSEALVNAINFGYTYLINHSLVKINSEDLKHGITQVEKVLSNVLNL